MSTSRSGEGINPRDVWLALSLEILHMLIYQEQFGSISDSPYHSDFHPSEMICTVRYWIHTVPFPAKVSPPFSQTHLLEGEQEVNLCVSPRSCLLPLLRLHDIGGQGPYAIHQPLGLLKLGAQTNVDLAAASGAHLGVRRSVCRPILNISELLVF